METSVKFERDIIKGFLNGYGTPKVLQSFHSDSFDTPVFSSVFEVILDYWTKFGDTPSVDVLMNEIRKITGVNKDEIAYLDAFFSKPLEVANDKFLYAVGEVEKAYLSKKLRFAMKNALKHLDNNDPKQAQDALLKDVSNTAVQGRDIKVSDFVLDFQKRKDNLVDRANNPDKLKEFCVATGIAKLDYELDGGLRKGELGLFMAPPEGGKSISLQDISITAMLNGFKVAFVTIEMTVEQTSYRLDSRLTQIRYRQFRRAQLSEDELKQWEADISKLKDNSMKVIGVPEGCSARVIETELGKLAPLFVPDALVIDYAGIMSPNEGIYGSSMDWKFVGAIVRNLKGLAIKMNIPVWSATQLLVGAKEKQEVSFVDVGLARQQIAAHADVCVAILQTAQMRALDVTRLQMVKVREGCTTRHLDIVSDYDRISLVKRDNNQVTIVKEEFKEEAEVDEDNNRVPF